jgi:translation initiation factor IF-2
MRVHELAKELGLTSKDLMMQLSELGIEVKSHSSSLDESSIAEVKNRIRGEAGGSGGDEPSASKSQPARPDAPPRGGQRRPPRPGGRHVSAASGPRTKPSSSQTAGSGSTGASSTDRKARVQRALIQRQLAKRQKATKKEKPKPPVEPEITIQIIEEEEPKKPKEEPKPAKPKAKAEERPKPEEKKGKPKGSKPPAKGKPEELEILTPEELAAKAEAAKKKPKKKEGEPKKPPKGAPRSKGREKDHTREVIAESMEMTGGNVAVPVDAVRAGVPQPGLRRRPPRPPRPRGRGGAAGGSRKKSHRRKKMQRLEQQRIEQQKREEQEQRTVTVHEATTVADLADGMHMPVNELIAKLMEMGIFAAKNQRLDRETIDIVCEELGFEVREASLIEDSPLLEDEEEEDRPEDLIPRPPVITIMGHVDHGKTKLLDALRDSDIVAGEAGGITQHIGAYDVALKQGRVVFLDTPGHEAFTAMRARGAMVTDIVVLVVAADDGVMPQTMEAINHAKAAEVPIIVAINKVDLPSADPNRVLTELGQHGLVPEQWGGKIPVVQISALKRQGLEDLLEVLLLESEVLELKANPDRRARGTIIEAKMDEGRGPVATVLVESGTLKTGDNFVSGIFSGKTRAMINDRGKNVEEAGPATPVEILGIDGVPVAGDMFHVVPDERVARQLSLKLQHIQRVRDLRKARHVSLEDLHAQITQGEIKELNIIVKADVQGSVGAIVDALGKLPSERVKINIIHQGVGTVSESDVMLASASNAIILGFNVRPAPPVEDLAKAEHVDIRTYRIIYDAIADIRNAMEGMLESKYKEVSLGRCEVREVFRVDKQGIITGCYVTSGKMLRNAKMRILRDDIVIHEGALDSLRRFKEDVKEVASGFECGIGVSRFNDVRVGDVIECYTLEEVKQTLEG